MVFIARYTKRFNTACIRNLNNSAKKLAPSRRRKWVNLGIAVVGTLAITSFLITPSVSSGPSMMPTLDERGEVMILDLWSYNFLIRKKPKRGEIIVSESPITKKYLICKRVLAVEGDMILFVRELNDRTMNDILTHLDELLVHTSPSKTDMKNELSPQINQHLENSTISSSSSVNNSEYNPLSNMIIYKHILSPNTVWLGGDNINNSRDSRVFGPLPLSLIVGRVICSIMRYHPWNWLHLDISMKWLYNQDILYMKKIVSPQNTTTNTTNNTINTTNTTNGDYSQMRCIYNYNSNNKMILIYLYEENRYNLTPKNSDVSGIITDEIHT